MSERPPANPGEQRRRRELGGYYTPPEIVAHVLCSAGYPPESGGALLCDPSCGSGRFLAEAARLLARPSPNGPSRPLVIDRIIGSIYGLDIDPGAVRAARSAVAAELRRAASSMRLEGRALQRMNPDAVNVYVSDSLLPPRAGDPPVVRRLKQLKGEFAGGFDFIVGNPPWGAAVSRGVAAGYVDRRRYRSRPESAFLFVELGLRLLREGGLLAFVLPDTILIKEYPWIRRLLLDSACIEEIAHVGKAFPGVDMDAVIVVARREARHVVRMRNRVRVVMRGDRGAPGERLVPQSSFEEEPGFRFNVFIDEAGARLRRAMEARGVPLGELGETREGIHSGNVRPKIDRCCSRVARSGPTRSGGGAGTSGTIRG